MKPVCEHRNYCKNDDKSLYIGQTHHISHPSHRNNNNYFPSGWGPIRNQFKGLCFYAAKVQGGGNALCNRPINSHSWQGPGYNPGFMCGRGIIFSASLKAQNGVAAADYVFEISYLSSKRGTYSNLMRSSCKVIGMKPLCDHPSYCRNDANALYIGQNMHISYPPHRESDIQMPYGFASVKGEMKGKCFYANNAAGARGLCNIPINTHSWRYPSQANPGFVCGKVKPKVFQGKLGAKNGVKAAT